MPKEGAGRECPVSQSCGLCLGSTARGRVTRKRHWPDEPDLTETAGARLRSVACRIKIGCGTCVRVSTERHSCISLATSFGKVPGRHLRLCGMSSFLERLVVVARSTPLAFALSCWLALGASLSHADVVIDWNQVTLQAIRTGKETPQRASRALAMTHTAIYDAVNSIDDTHQPYLVNLDVPASTSREAAAAQAAHDVLVSVYPGQAATFDAALATSLSGIVDGAPKAAGIQLGSSVAASWPCARTITRLTSFLTLPAMSRGAGVRRRRPTLLRSFRTGRWLHLGR